MVASFFGKVLESAALDSASQRRETPFSRSADATGGSTVFRAAWSTSSVSTALHAAG